VVVLSTVGVYVQPRDPDKEVPNNSIPDEEGSSDDAIGGSV